MKIYRIEEVTDQYLQQLANELGRCLEKGEATESKVGFFQLSKELERRGLEMVSDRRNKIVLQPKKKVE